MNSQDIINAIQPGLIFQKPNIKSLITKIDKTGFHYSIGTNGNSKKVTYDVFKKCYTHFHSTGEFSREWFTSTFPKLAKAAPCTYTTIGGLFQHFNLATYRKPKYTKYDKL